MARRSIRTRLTRLVNAGLCAIILMAMSTGCGAGGVETSGPLVRDSAGIEIVENMAPAWSPGEEWRLSDVPLVSVGEADGADEYLFHGVLGSQKLSDGRIAVVDRGTSELRFFDREGRFIERVGGEGDGPGEFRFMSLVWWLPGDSAVVADMQGLTVHDPEGGVARTIALRITGDGLPLQPVAQLDDGAILAAGSAAGAQPSEPGSIIQDTIHYHRFTRSGVYAGYLTSLPGPKTMMVGSAAGGVAPRRLPFSSHPAMGVAGDAFVLTGSADAELEVWDQDGALQRLIRWAPHSRAVTFEHMNEYRDHHLESMSGADAERVLDRFLIDAPVPERFPATGEVDAILTDPKGYLWVEAYRLPWQDDTAWFVFTPEGGWLGTVDMPDGFELHQVGRDFVVGRWHDEMGVEFVHVYGLGRG